MNYSGLRKRDTYDEIVKLLETDTTKVKYPSRVASQILNSPYMKQLDAESLTDIQQQQDMVSKGQLKQLIIQDLAQQTDTPYVQLRAQADAEQQQGALQQVANQAEYHDAVEDQVMDFREELGQMLEAHTQTDQERRHAVAVQASMQLEELGQTIPSMLAAERAVQTEANTINKSTQTLVRPEEDKEELAMRHEEIGRQMAEMLRRERHVALQYQKLTERMGGHERAKARDAEHRVSLSKLSRDITTMAGKGQIDKAAAQTTLSQLQNELTAMKNGDYVRAGMHAQPAQASASSSGQWTMGTLGSMTNMFNIFTPREGRGTAVKRERAKSESPKPASVRAKSEDGGDVFVI